MQSIRQEYSHDQTDDAAAPAHVFGRACIKSHPEKSASRVAIDGPIRSPFVTVEKRGHSSRLEVSAVLVSRHLLMTSEDDLESGEAANLSTHKSLKRFL